MTVIASAAPVYIPFGEDDPGQMRLGSQTLRNAYDFSKALQECLARQFFSHGLPVKCIRLGHVVNGERETNLADEMPLKEMRYCRGGWVAAEDVAAAFLAALSGPPDHQFLVYTVVGSKPARARFGVADTERRLGIKLRYEFAGFE